MSAATVAKEPKTRWLNCACCGTGTRGRQWFNQDTGYGLCAKCWDWIEGRDKSMTPERMERTYGKRGYHCDIPGEPTL